jgi:hypothetical protein
VRVKDQRRKGGRAGVVVGALVGLLGGPVGVVAGATAGGAAGKAHAARIMNDSIPLLEDESAPERLAERAATGYGPGR